MNWNSILEQFIAGGAVALLFGFFFPIWWKKTQTPSLIVIENEGKNSEVETVLGDGVKTFSAKLLLRNLSSVTLEDVYWKLIVPPSVKVNSPEVSSTVDGFQVIAGSIENRIYPMRARAIPTFKGSFPDGVDSVTVYYEISTEYGLYPQGIRSTYDRSGITFYKENNLEKYGKIKLK